MLRKVLLYYRTLRRLKPVQIYGRVWFKLYTPKPSMAPAPPVRTVEHPWSAPIDGSQKMLSATRFRFLNEEHECRTCGDWNNPTYSKLWIYNLHYFDYLNDTDADAETARTIVQRWIHENPPGSGNGWEPYPLSLRIVNWIKWHLAGNALDQAMLNSLAIQCRHLSRRVEYHILGNHLFANAKAMIFAGCFFDSTEATEWLERGLAILDRQIREQVLGDGGHFELSPMYHSIILCDILDLINLRHAYGVPETDRRPAEWRQTASHMLGWLDHMTHPDGRIAFFNDAAHGIAPSPNSLKAYASRSGIGYPPRPTAMAAHQPGPVIYTHLQQSGYIHIAATSYTAILDVADIGPSYLPAHGHADVTSFEFSLDGQRVFVNSGTSCYGTGDERQLQRGTAAHNCVVVDGRNSSEVWSGFRVGRRASVRDASVSSDAMKSIRVRCTHDGYRRRNGPGHCHREWTFRETGVEIRDTVDGKFHDACAWIHLHPDVAAQPGNHGVSLTSGSYTIDFHVEGGLVTLEPSTFHPGFGVSRTSQSIRIRFDGSTIRYYWHWRQR